MLATLAPDHVLFDSHGLFTSGEILRSDAEDRIIRVEAAGTNPPRLTILVVDENV